MIVLLLATLLQAKTTLTSDQILHAKYVRAGCFYATIHHLKYKAEEKDFAFCERLYTEQLIYEEWDRKGKWNLPKKEMSR